MAGHNKWSKVKHIKAVTDAKKSALYSKYIKEITVAAKMGGADPEANSRLRKAIADAKSQSVPRDNIERALKKASGEGADANALEELLYEGYGPAGIAILVETVTDKKTRTQPELRKIFERGGGNIAEQGAVSWGFDHKGLLLVAKESISEEKLIEVALEAGAEDIKSVEEGYEVITPPTQFMAVVDTFEQHKISTELSELTYIPQNKTAVSGEEAEKLQRLIENLEEHDDVQRVTSNAED